ncbi:MAG: hypothetical protein V1659_00655 [Candidatus Woesearchaeota archaeon]
MAYKTEQNSVDKKTLAKPILAIDFDGALFYSRPFREAHKKWFELMASLLHDESVKEYAFREDYFRYVHEVMRRYVGNVDENSLNFFARGIYAMATLAEVRQEDLVKEFAAYLESIKNSFTLALVTTAPASCVDPILQKIGCAGLFDIVCKSPMAEQPDKKRLLQQFIAEHGKPRAYIGEGDKDIATCRELGIPTISAGWVNQGKIIGDYNADTVSELESIIKEQFQEDGR